MSLPVPIPESSKEKHARYPEYKDSEIEWLGEIPAHWETKKLKSIGWIRAGAGFPDAEQGLVNEGLPFYKVSDMNLDGNEILMKSHNNSVSKETAKRLGATIFPSDTIIFPKVGIALLTNKRRILHCQACLDNNTMGFYVRVGSVKFMYYRLLTLDFGRLANPGAVPSMNESQVNNLYINIPPIEEQQVIADYLDQETTKIDQLVEKKKRLIELLEEQRTAIITHAVTKGLNPDVEIKDSGVEWLGEIPEHWDLKTVKRIFKVFNGSTPKSSEPSFWDGEIPWVTPEDLGELTTNEIDKTKRNITKAGYASCGTIMVPVGSIVLSTRAPIGHLAIAKIELCTNQGCRSLVPNANVNHNYGFYVLYSARQELVSFGQGSTFMELGKSKLEAVSLPLPPIEEQQTIADYLDKETARIDNLINKINQAIEKLQEYRSALITAAVTGKIDVRQHVS